MVEAILVLGKPNSILHRVIFQETVMIWSLVHIIISELDPPWCYFLVGIIQLVLQTFLSFLLVVYMVKVVWVLGPPILPT